MPRRQAQQLRVLCLQPREQLFLVRIARLRRGTGCAFELTFQTEVFAIECEHLRNQLALLDEDVGLYGLVTQPSEEPTSSARRPVRSFLHRMGRTEQGRPGPDWVR